MSSFKWQDGEVFIKPATGRTRAYYNYLKSVAEVYTIENIPERIAHIQVLGLLARTDKVVGDIGFHVPNGDANKENLNTFCNAVLDAPENLFVLWDDTVINTIAGGNDIELLPPDELSDDEKKDTDTNADNNKKPRKRGLKNS